MILIKAIPARENTLVDWKMADRERIASRRRFLLLGTAPASSATADEGPRKARIALECLALKGIVCRTCGEHCEPRAIHFQLLPGGRSFPLIDEDCNACGECLPVCPVGAISLGSAEEALA